VSGETIDVHPFGVIAENRLPFDSTNANVLQCSRGWIALYIPHIQVFEDLFNYFRIIDTGPFS
jgi:hypothetical protein